VKKKQIQAAAKLAGEWWSERLASSLSGHREAFAQAVAKRVEQELSGECYWDWRGQRHEGKGWSEAPSARTEFDYDPHYLLCEALAEAFPGMEPWDARKALPFKHDLDIRLNELRPKEGYGNWVPAIQVKAPA
jgi:hypothetical protein